MKLVKEYLEPLFEIGEATAKPYKITKFSGSLMTGSKVYEFETEDGDIYEIIIQALDNTLANVSFRIKGSETTNEVINKGRIFRILSTVVDCMKLFYKSYNGDIAFMIIADKSKADDSRRFNIYSKYVKTIVPNWKIHSGKTQIGDAFYDKMIIHPDDMYCSLCEN